MSNSLSDAVTGAFGFSGRAIATRLRARGREVRTLTNSPAHPDPFGGAVSVHPLDFGDFRGLCASLAGVEVLYNTYWVRFNHARFTHAEAVENTLRLFAAARAAGVRRVVHVSITHPHEDSPFEYFAGKARLERALRESGLSHAILRPAVLFGPGDILINNLAWALRRFPFFTVFGDGSYRLQPIFVDDLADLAVAEGAATRDSTTEAIGPETFSYIGLVRALGAAIGRPRPILKVPPVLGYCLARLIGAWMRDRFLTWAEIRGLMAGLLAVDDAPPAGRTRLTAWAQAHAGELGREYASELARRPWATVRPARTRP